MWLFHPELQEKGKMRSGSSPAVLAKGILLVVLLQAEIFCGSWEAPFKAAQHCFLEMNFVSSLETSVHELGHLFVTSFSASQREYLSCL